MIAFSVDEAEPIDEDRYHVNPGCWTGPDNLRTESDAKLYANDIAEYYSDNHDGWEAHWPIKLWVYGEDGREFGPFTVDRLEVYKFAVVPTPGEPR